MNESITIETYVNAPIEKVWSDFTNPEAMKIWNTASDDWHTTRVENDLKVGGTLSARMEAKDGSVGFDFKGVYTAIEPHRRIAYTLEDGRRVEVTFAPDEDGVRVVETFEPESENTHEMQRSGWQAILNNFKQYSESAA